MTDYDSDSTEAEGGYTETNVLLGYASRDADEDTISKLGGHPDWLDAEKPPSAALARCGACNDVMTLLLQLNGELPERFPGYERRLYVFACRRSACRRKDGSIRVLRGVRAWEDDEAAQEAAGPEAGKAGDGNEAGTKPDGPGLGEALFGATTMGGGAGAGNSFSTIANPFGAAPPSPTPSNPFATPPAGTAPSDTTSPSLTRTFAKMLSLNAPPPSPPAPPPHEPWPAAPAWPAPFPTLYLADAGYETLDSTPAAVPAGTRLEAADAPEPSALDREAFESAMDDTFQKFADRLAQNPDQVIRYDFTGAPLLYSKTDPVGDALARGAAPPPCPRCAAPRAFEVQLTPNAIAELEADDLSLEGMEWGTVIVAVCERDCLPSHTAQGEAAYLEEWAGVQWEEQTTAKQK